LVFAEKVGREITAGMNVDVRVNSANKQADSTGVTLPPCAVFKQDGADCVWVFSEKDSTVSARKVVLAGMDADGKLKVSGGLSGAERVVRAGVSALHDGERVKVVGAQSESNVGGLL
jgi:hypothetical protein